MHKLKKIKGSAFFMSKNTYEDKKNIKHQIGEKEDATKYGEFVSSYFAWITLDKQKENAKKMEEMTKKK